MSIFIVKDLNTGVTRATNGTPAVIGGVTFNELNTLNSPDSYQVTATATSDVAVLTGSGNDMIDTSHVTGRMTFIDAGSGTNTITAGAGITNVSMSTSASQAWTSDLISNFHAGDSLTFNGATSISETIRGNNLVYTAFNPAVAGSAIYATLVSPSVGTFSVTHTANSVTIHA